MTPLFKDKDIDDNEIRIIQADSTLPVRGEQGRKSRWPWLLLLSIILVGICVLAVIFWPADDAVEEIEVQPVQQQTALSDDAPDVEAEAPAVVAPVSSKAYTTRTDTVVNGVSLIMLTPQYATATLEVGDDVTSDSMAVLMVQAADIRADNGDIVGSCVVKGELISKGEAKSGFCSIINGEVSVGVADATPMFEQALTTGGYFFRQYPLVVGGQIVENKPKGKSFRRALADVDGRISVVISSTRLTFHNFSQALIDLGVRNAIYLVGGSAYGSYVDADGNVFALGQKWDQTMVNVNYIVWR